MKNKFEKQLMAFNGGGCGLKINNDGMHSCLEGKKDESI